MFRLLFDFRGRTNRTGWFIGQFACLLLAVFWMCAPFIIDGRSLVTTINSAKTYAKGTAGFDMGQFWSTPGLALFGLLFIRIYLASTVKRFHDLGRSGHLALLALIPTVYQVATLSGCEVCATPLENPAFAILMTFVPSIIGMWLFATCGMTKGEQIENQWGPPPGALGMSGARHQRNDPAEKPSRFDKFDDKYFEDYANQLARKAAAAQASSNAFIGDNSRPTFGKR